MAGSTFGNLFKVTTFGESHGAALGAVIDGCPAGLPLSEDDIRPYLNRRKPGNSKYATQRSESDDVRILSGIFDGVTTGTPISLLIENNDQHSGDYSDIEDLFRPGHADYGFFEKYGIRDYRGGGRSSGRETAARVAAGAVALTILKRLGIEVYAYTESIGPVQISWFDKEERDKNSLCMPDKDACAEASIFLEGCMAEGDSAGGVIACRVTGVPAGIGEPVFDKMDSDLAKAIMSIGAVKGFEIGDGFDVTSLKGSENNDSFLSENGVIKKSTNHSGGTLGGISDGSDLFFRAAVKPTPSISQKQKTVNENGENTEIEIKGRHDPVIVPRAVVVVEAMTAITVLDLMMRNMTSRLSGIEEFYRTDL